MRSEFDGLARTPLGRRALLKYLGGTATLGVAGFLAACQKQPAGSPGTSPTTAAHAPIEEEPGTLRAYTWAGYDLKPLFRPYRQAGYPDPRFSFFTNTEQALAKTAAGSAQWDTAHPEIGYIQDYLNIGAIQPWDTSLIPNFDQLNPTLQERGQVDGRQYEIVTDWGYSGVIIRSDRVDPSVNSYSYLFEGDAAGHISWFDTPWILQQAGLVLGVPGPETFDMTPEQLDECTKYCIDRKRNVYNIWVDFNAMWEDVRQGNVWAAYSWPDTFAFLHEEVEVEYIKPKEGVLSWAEGLVLNAETENYHHAHEYAASWADPELGLWLIQNYGYGHANLNIDLNQVDPDVVRVFGLEDPETALSEPNSYIDRFQPNRAAYNRAWDEVKAA
jgi:spermidine/putrescine transport system substrate-binding protein